MKLRVYFRPAVIVLLLAFAASLSWWATRALSLLLLPLPVFYTLLFLLSAWAWLRIGRLEQWREWSTAGRLLILAPHEDDCVIAAGGIAIRNQKLGGVTRIIYLAPDRRPEVAARRAAEATAAWREIGLSDGDLLRLDLLPPLAERDPPKLREAAARLRTIIDGFAPTTVIVPMFEGGHVQHDMTAALLGLITRPSDRFEVLEAPEYGPYVSLNNTPHRILTLCGRWLLGLVSYYGPPDGIDERPVYKFRLDADDLASKRRMFAAFVSQNAPSLILTKSYPDRFVRLVPGADRAQPFDFRCSLLRFVLAARRLIPARLVDRLLPVQLGTIGRQPAITDWRQEWSSAE